jgi:hypothetical protein
VLSRTGLSVYRGELDCLMGKAVLSRKVSSKKLDRGGGGGIRTPETLSGLTVFKTAGFNRSPTPPSTILPRTPLPISKNARIRLKFRLFLPIQQWEPTDLRFRIAVHYRQISLSAAGQKLTASAPLFQRGTAGLITLFHICFSFRSFLLHPAET